MRSSAPLSASSSRLPRSAGGEQQKHDADSRRVKRDHRAFLFSPTMSRISTETKPPTLSPLAGRGVAIEIALCGLIAHGAQDSIRGSAAAAASGRRWPARSTASQVRHGARQRRHRDLLQQARDICAATGLELSCRIRIGFAARCGRERDWIGAKAGGNNEGDRSGAAFDGCFGGGSGVLGRRRLPGFGFGARVGGQRALPCIAADPGARKPRLRSSSTHTGRSRAAWNCPTWGRTRGQDAEEGDRQTKQRISAPRSRRSARKPLRTMAAIIVGGPFGSCKNTDSRLGRRRPDR